MGDIDGDDTKVRQAKVYIGFRIWNNSIQNGVNNIYDGLEQRKDAHLFLDMQVSFVKSVNSTAMSGDGKKQNLVFLRLILNNVFLMSGTMLEQVRPYLHRKRWFTVYNYETNVVKLKKIEWALIRLLAPLLCSRMRVLLEDITAYILPSVRDIALIAIFTLLACDCDESSYPRGGIFLL